MNEERYRKLKASAQRYTAYRERSPKEVIDKLREWDAPEEITDRIVEELKADNFIDERRFARAYCHDKFLINKWGRNRIRLELKKYGLSEEAIQEGMAYIDSKKYQEVLLSLAKSKWQKVKDTDIYQKKQKTVRYLLQKGYESELVWGVVGGFEVEN